MWALIIDGLVFEVSELDPAGRFADDMDWRAAPADVALGWVVEGEDIVAPAPPAPPTAGELSDYAALRRWQVETGGIVVASATSAAIA